MWAKKRYVQYVSRKNFGEEEVQYVSYKYFDLKEVQYVTQTHFGQKRYSTSVINISAKKEVQYISHKYFGQKEVQYPYCMNTTSLPGTQLYQVQQ